MPTRKPPSGMLELLAASTDRRAAAPDRESTEMILLYCPSHWMLALQKVNTLYKADISLALSGPLEAPSDIGS